jgi:predicted SAM-dependent methyltransferase
LEYYLKVVIGAGKTQYDGWYHTQEEDLNLLNSHLFKKHFPHRDVECFLAEHIWEHLTIEEGIIAAKNCYDFLQPGGYIRIAVPDKNFHNEWYQNMVQVGGPGPKDHPAATHKIVYGYTTLIGMLEESGFQVNLLEYCDENGNFHYKYWNNSDGHIGRSYRYDTRNSIEKLGMVSLIVDACKVLKIADT